MEFGIVVLIVVIIYLSINGKRNSDPLNRKCAAEICELLTNNDECTPEEIARLFMNNARYNKQANHIVSMIPPLLMKSGYPRDVAMGVVPLLRSAQTLVPR